MKYRNLGSTGIEVSEIGFGAWGIGGLTERATSYGKTDDKVSTIALRKAYDEGVNFFDTSNVYGNGHSEDLLGKTFRGDRDNIVLASKAGFSRHEGPQDFTPQNLRGSLEGSLDRLQTDYIDLFQLHSPDVGLLERYPEIIGTLQDLKGEGKIRAYGISVRSPEEGLIAVENYQFDTVQVNFNLLDQRAVKTGLVERCGEDGVGLIIRTPLCFGFLSGDYEKGHEFDSTDHRATWSEAQRDLWADAYLQFKSALDPSIDQSNVQAALRYCLSYDSISSVIPGMMNEEEVVENVMASDLGSLTSEEVLKMESIVDKSNFFLGKK